MFECSIQEHRFRGKKKERKEKETGVQTQSKLRPLSKLGEIFFCLVRDD